MATVFIDNSHLFGGPNWNYSNFKRPSSKARTTLRNTISEADLEWSIAKIRKVLPTEIDRSLSEIPEPWITGDVSALQDTLYQRLVGLESLVWDAYDGFKKETCLERNTTAPPSLFSALHCTGQREWIVSAGSNQRIRWT
jgi:hypothetical protein